MNKILSGTNIHIPYDVLKSPQLVSVAVRNNNSPTALASTLETLIETCDGETSTVNLHPSQSYRYRVETVTKIAEQIKEDWTPLDPASIHRNGKLMETLWI